MTKNISKSRAKMQNQEIQQSEKRKPHLNWNKRDVIFLVLPIIFTILVPLQGLPYLCGRLNYHMVPIFCMLYPAIGIFIMCCFFASIVRLFGGWRKHTKKKILIVAEISIPIVFIVLFIAPFFIPVESHLSPPGVAFLYGFRDRVRSRANISAIRNWLKTLDKGDYVPRRDYYYPDKLPEPLKGLGFLGMVSLSEDKSGNPEVNISAGGGFHHWGATIGLEDMVIPESDLSFHYDAWLLVEPGVYVYAW